MNILSLALILFITLLLVSLFRPKEITDYLLLGYLFLFLTIIETGVIASLFHRFNEINTWVIIQSIFILTTLSAFFVLKKRNSFSPIEFHFEWKNQDRFEKIGLGILGLTIGMVLILTLISLLFAAPQNTDALTYHLARVAFYLQHGNMEYYPANQWPQVIHPKNSASLFAYIFLVSGYSENLTPLPQFISFLVTIVSVYGISKKLGLDKPSSLISSLLTGLPICLILGATTNQNDLIICAMAGCAVYFLLCFRSYSERKYLFLSALSLSLMTGFKASALMVFPVVGMVVLFSLVGKQWIPSLKNIGILAGFGVLLFIVLVLPSGYLENMWMYGHPVGPEYMRKEHNFEGLSFSNVFYQGSMNTVRYFLNFWNFDGFLNGPNIIYGINSILWEWITSMVTNIWPDIYSQAFVRQPFGTLKKITADEESVYFGPMGFLLIWPMIFWGFFYSILNLRKPLGNTLLFLSSACFIFLFSQSFFGQFDPWRGRMFGTMMLFAAPICGIWWSIYNKYIISKIYLLFVLLIGCWAAIWSILFRYDSSWIKPNFTGKTLFKMDRMEQMLRDLPYDYEPYRKFDEMVPKDAKVNSWLMGSYPEYVLFGKGLTRKIYTREESLKNGIKADYFIFDSKQFEVRSNDIALGNGLQLRKLD